MDEPGDDVYYYGLLNPPTLEEYLELLRTEWEDRLFVMAGGVMAGGMDRGFHRLNTTVLSVANVLYYMQTLMRGDVCVIDI